MDLMEIDGKVWIQEVNLVWKSKKHKLEIDGKVWIQEVNLVWKSKRHKLLQGI